MRDILTPVRWAWLCLLAGCYQPAKFCKGDGCPTGDASGDGATDGFLTDGNTDAMPIEACTGKLFAEQPTLPLIGSGASYTTNGEIAIFEDDDIRQTFADVAGIGALLKFTSTPMFRLSRPRLSADGETLFALGQSINDDSFSLVKMERVLPDRWDPPVAVVITAPANLVDQDFVPGVSSGTDPRHMIVRATGGLFEGVEQAGGKWAFTALSFPNAADPYLSKDGRALLFVGQDDKGIQIQRATRATLDAPFDPPAALYNFGGSGGGGGGNERTPALSPDCEKLYWSLDAAPGVFTAAD